jgi:hypothetical protein
MATKETMKIFRASQSPLLAEAARIHEMPYTPSPPDAEAGVARMAEAGMEDGFVIKVLFSAPGFSLIYAWFKAGFPLARHSHDKDCLYYVISGAVKLGTERLGPGDGFFVPKDAPYMYGVGDTGVEILEFRHDSLFDSRTSSASQEYWDKAVKIITDSRSAWLAAEPPIPARRDHFG